MVLGLMPPPPCTGMDILGAAGLVSDCSFSDVQLHANSCTSNTRGAIKSPGSDWSDHSMCEAGASQKLVILGQ